MSLKRWRVRVAPGAGAALRDVEHSSVVFIVDDEPQVAAAHARALRRPGLRVEVCVSPLSALDRLSAGERFDAVVCDGRMPEVDGVELLRRARVAWPGLDERIVFVSGGLDEEDALFIREQALPLLTKPLARSRDDLKGVVRALLARSPAARGEAPTTSGVCSSAPRVSRLGHRAPASWCRGRTLS
jgi:DNA-binding response OmpR family regulator